ncbi:MAG: hypothetical protein M1833_000658 [Piccolia ochrophora]|nr:MAG: hypothetical protein M1833_000658 [Piccolia ochrophora]
MEDPIKDIPHVIRSLTQSSPHIQQQTLLTYFAPSARFTHPFCRTGSFANSRWLIWMIYRWYKILSPRIELDIDSVGASPRSSPAMTCVKDDRSRVDQAYDAQSKRLYVSLHQRFQIWLFPIYAAHVSLVTVLDLEYDKERKVYLITSQNDLYQTDEFVKFFLPGGWLFTWIWQFLATALCVVGALVLWPFSWAEDRIAANR